MAPPPIKNGRAQISPDYKRIPARCFDFRRSADLTLPQVKFKGSKATPMLYVVEIQRERDRLSETMSAIREWLDGHHFEPDVRFDAPRMTKA
jgi:hypothetical protein